MVSASSWSCVTITVVRPKRLLQLADLDGASVRSAWRRGSTAARRGGARRGRMASARASATRCCWPPESWRGIAPAEMNPARTSSSASCDALFDHLQVGRTLLHLEVRKRRCRSNMSCGEKARSSGTPSRRCAFARAAVSVMSAWSQSIMGAAAGGDEARDHAQGFGGLAAARRPEQRDEFAAAPRRGRWRRRPARRPLVEQLADAAQFQVQRHALSPQGTAHGQKARVGRQSDDQPRLRSAICRDRRDGGVVVEYST